MDSKEKHQTIHYVTQKIQDGAYSLIKKRGRSDAWNKFSLVIDTETKNSMYYVVCDVCKVVLRFKPKSGTTHLKRHICKFGEARRSATSLPAAVKMNFTEKCVMMCAMDLRPFATVEGEGFRILAQELINAGAKYGEVSVSDVLPHRSTVAPNIADKANRLRETIIPTIVHAARQNACAMTTDLWTDCFKKVHYMAVTSHHITKDWKLSNNVLLMCKFPDALKTGANIRAELDERLAALGFPEDVLSRITFVTDQGANMKKALEKYNRLPCTAHCISTVLRHALEHGFLSENAKNVLSSINAVKTVVSYLKRSGHVSKLKKTVHQDIETRWNSKYIMLASVHEQIDDIRGVLREIGEEGKLDGYNDELVKEMLPFLVKFKEATDYLESETEPTLQLVLLWLNKLRRHCETTSADSKELQSLKGRVMCYLNLKMVTDKIHLVATFLWPSFRHLLVLPAADRERTYQCVQQICSTISPSETGDLIQETAASDRLTSPPKRRKLFSEWHAEGSMSTSLDEIAAYRALPNVGNDDDLLKWWQAREATFPRLALLARQLLCIPATSAASERAFSAAVQIVTNKRSNISPEKVDDLLFLNRNLDEVFSSSAVPRNESAAGTSSAL